MFIPELFIAVIVSLILSGLFVLATRRGAEGNTGDTCQEGSSQRDFSEETARIIDKEIQRITKDMESKSVETLTSNREGLDSIANELLAHETLSKEDIDRISAQEGNSSVEEQASN